jgi:triosephosphate isomerase
MANIFLKIGRGIEVGAEDVLKWAKEAQSVTTKITPAQLAAIGVLAGGIAKAAADVTIDASNPVALLLGGASQAQDFMAVWPELKTVLQDFGITKI